MAKDSPGRAWAGLLRDAARLVGQRMTVLDLKALLVGGWHGPKVLQAEKLLLLFKSDFLFRSLL